MSEIGHRRTGLGGSEHVCTSDEVRDLVATPTVPLDTDRLLVNESLLHDTFDPRQHSVFGALSGVSRFVRV
jgi:hypothetical protein